MNGAIPAQTGTQPETQTATQTFGTEAAYGDAGGLNPIAGTDASAAGEESGSLSSSAMRAGEMITVLEESPDLTMTLKNLVGQGFGVDSSLVSDEGLYNCIRLDASFRKTASEQLRILGYIPAEESQTPRMGQPANRMAGPRQPAIPEDSTSQTQFKKPAPYPWVPSLTDLYTQEVAPSKILRRFGSDMFRTGTGNANRLPIDLPVGPDYVLGPGDSLVINMWGGQSARIERSIDRQGQIALPEAGAVTLAGYTIAQAQEIARRALNTQYQNERVEISLGRVRTVRIYVVGDVQRPGAYDVSALSTALNALYAAGGPTSRGSLRILRHLRGTELIREVDLYDLLLRGVRSEIDRLQPGDTILVPPVGAQVTVAGMVRRPAIYELKSEQTLDDALKLAGGLLSAASLREIRVTRVQAHERRTMVSVRVPDGSAEEAAKLSQVKVQDQDEVLVSPILPYNEQMVYLEGHVFKPGPYAWHEGLTATDLLHSYQDVLPEPANHAEIIRLRPPDFRPETISFNLPDLLIGDSRVLLQPFDVVRVFGRYEIDPPKVSIFGPVLRPGSYPMSEGMTVSALVRAAGGFRRSAYQQEADLSSYVIQNGEKVQLGHRVIQIDKALAGDKTADALLKPGDVVGIRQITGWQDIGASITLDGEVKYAGTYGIEDGERLSSVLKRAGGFRQDAYPVGAIFERTQVRQMEESSRQEMIRRIESSVPHVAPGISATQDQQGLLQSMRQQQQDVLASLRSHPSSGRLVVRISLDIDSWQNTPADIVVRAGDKLTVPKKPEFVLVSGQVYNATAITYHAGKNASWYLHQAGGATRSGDKKEVFILRADGSVVGGQGSGIFRSGVLDMRMQPGDSIIVPEKIVGGSMLWRNLLETAQIVSSIAMTGALVGTR